MIEFFQAGGWLMFPILFSSVLALAIVFERSLNLRKANVLPESAIDRARKLAQRGSLSPSDIDQVRTSSMIGRVLATALDGANLPRHVLKENVEEAGRHVVHDMERYMTALGTIAAITPLMGLLGTVLGMIQVFSVITQVGVGNPSDLAEGISQALITTAAGIFVAIVSLIFHRYFKAKIDNYIISMEKEAMSLLEITNNTNRRMSTPPSSNTGAAASQQAIRGKAAASQQAQKLAAARAKASAARKQS